MIVSELGGRPGRKDSTISREVGNQSCMIMNKAGGLLHPICSVLEKLWNMDTSQHTQAHTHTGTHTHTTRAL